MLLSAQSQSASKRPFCSNFFVDLHENKTRISLEWRTTKEFICVSWVKEIEWHKNAYEWIRDFNKFIWLFKKRLQCSDEALENSRELSVVKMKLVNNSVSFEALTSSQLASCSSCHSVINSNAKTVIIESNETRHCRFILDCVRFVIVLLY